MKTCKALVLSAFFVSLSFSMTAHAGDVTGKAQADYFNMQYEMMTRKPGTLANAIYMAMKEDPVRAKAALAEMMLMK